MPVRASTQTVEASGLQLPLNFVTEPEYPIVPVQTELPVQPERPVINIDPGTSDVATVSTFYAVNGTHYIAHNGLLVPITGTATSTAATVISTAVTGFYHNRTSDWTVITSATTTSTCVSTAGIYVNGTHFYVTGGPQPAMTEADRARYLKRQQLRAHADRKKAKGSIKRAVRTMLNLGFEEEARIFLRGETIEVSHPESLLKFVISKRPDSLFNRTINPGYSTPYELSVKTKCDMHVAKLCVYMEKTPILDQVMALALFIKSGSEEMILKKANWYSRTSDQELREILALEYPYLTPKLR